MGEREKQVQLDIKLPSPPKSKEISNLVEKNLIILNPYSHNFLTP